MFTIPLQDVCTRTWFRFLHLTLNPYLGLSFPVDVALLTKELDEFELRKMEARAVTGVLASHPNSTDVHISSLSLTFHGQELLSDTSLELNSGRRYGLIGLNGTGTGSTLIKHLYLALTTGSHTTTTLVPPHYCISSGNSPKLQFPQLFLATSQ